MKKDKIEIFKSASVIDTHAHVVLEETENSAGALGPEMLFDRWGDCFIYFMRLLLLFHSFVQIILF